MRKSTSISLFLFVAVLICCTAYGGGYYLSSYNSKKRTEQELASNQQKIQEESNDNAVKSDAVVKPYEFVLCEEDGYIIVYNADKKTVYSKTDIRLDNLSVQLQKEIIAGKPIYSESELYNFLESYSS